jgi:glycosyltransferase involved in cell wall biosynthesis
MTAKAPSGMPQRGTILWIIDGSLSRQLHKNARLKPAAELARSGWKVRMLTSGVPKDAESLPIDFIRVNWPNLYLVGAVVYYLRLLLLCFTAKYKADILFFQMDSFGVLMLAVPLWQKIMRRKTYTVVVDYRSLPMDTRTVKGKLRSAAFHMGAALAAHLDVRVTAITEQLARHLNVNKRQLVGIWPSGADITEFADCYEQRQWPSAQDPIRLIYLGVLTEERNLVAVIEAVRTARRRGIDLRLSFVGDGPYKGCLQNNLQPADDGCITVGGPVAYRQVPGLLARHDVGILPFPDVSKMKVSSAIKMFEYMAAGMPVLATRIEAHRTVFGEETFVFWCAEDATSMANAMSAIERSKNRLPALGLDAKIYSGNWSWEKSASKLSHSLTTAISC